MKPNMISLGIIIVFAAVLVVYFGGFGFDTAGRRATLTIGGRIFNIEVRDTAAGRSQGLSGREALGENEGMLFTFGSPGDYGFWMKDMKFPIDIVWIRDGKVVGVTEDVPPEPEKTMLSLTSYYPPSPADTVLELRAGAVADYGIAAGNKVTIGE